MKENETLIQTEKTALRRLKAIVSKWFLTENLLFSAVSTHSFVENPEISVPLRTGHLRIEFSPLLLENFSDSALETLLKIEVFRILLLHPYTRLPYKPKRGVILLASDVTINHFFKAKDVETEGVLFLKAEANRFKILEKSLGEKWSGTEEEKFCMRNLNLKPDGSLSTLDDLSFEAWYKRLVFLIENTSNAGENAGASDFNNFKDSQKAFEESELWEEYPEAALLVKDSIEKAFADDNWGSLSGGIERRILEESRTELSMDYRKILLQFRENSVRSKRRLTRMRPNRRTGFSHMGSVYERNANILVAVDVSGSINDEDLAKFFVAVKNFFFCGIEKLDAIFFDATLRKTEAITLKRNFSLSEMDGINGKGGTNFQVPLDYFFEHKDYDGLIIFTDGEAAIPSMKGRRENVLWILTNRTAFEKSKRWINTLEGNRSCYIP